MMMNMMSYWIYIVVIWFLNILLVLLSVAFFTLFERKVMGLFHNRLGPNKVSFVGLIQPLLDAFKLLSKQYMIPLSVNKFSYELAPQMALFLSLLVWVVLPFFYVSLEMVYSLIVFFLIGSILVFSVLFSGWSSNSKYSLIGSLRSVAQSISYESVMSTLLIVLLVLYQSFSFYSSIKYSSFLFFLVFPIWFICVLAETHRAPFDFSESESELVSGFNTEYSGVYFAFIFLSEYSMLLLSSILIVYIFFSWVIGIMSSYIFVIIFSLFISFIFIWVRITFCRFRYDFLMNMSWKMLLPLSLMVFFVMTFIFIF